MELIKEEVGENPILLLDDVTSELDLERVKNMVIKEKQQLVDLIDKAYEQLINVPKK